MIPPDASPARSASQSRPLVEVRALSKQFAGTTALSDVSLSVMPGEVLGLLGENGAGKSTLLKILSGAQPPSSGVLLFDDREVTLSSPLDAMALGIVTIYQELSLIPSLSVAENLFLGRLPTNRLGLVDWPRMRTLTMAVLADVGLALSPETLVSSLSVADQQMVEIARAVSRSSRLIIMDEPTSALSQDETETLLKIISSLQSRGVSIMFVTHRLEEASRICERAVILRDGHLSGVLLRKNNQPIPTAAMIERMVGRQASELYSRAKREHQDTRSVLLEARDLRTERNPEAPHAMVLDGATVQLRAGEILGVAGLVGSGRTELARVLFGADRLSSGTIILDGKQVRPTSPTEAIQLGIGLVPEDRKQQGIFSALAILSNFSIATLRAYSNRLGLMSGLKERDDLERFRKILSIRMSGSGQAIGNLSGGNQQKVILARWLASNPRILIVDEPTRGIDVGAKAEVHQILADLANRGIAVMMISSELPEILAVSDRIITMRQGRVTGSILADEATEEGLMTLMALSSSEGGAS